MGVRVYGLEVGSFGLGGGCAVPAQGYGPVAEGLAGFGLLV